MTHHIDASPCVYIAPIGKLLNVKLNVWGQATAEHEDRFTGLRGSPGVSLTGMVTLDRRKSGAGMDLSSRPSTMPSAPAAGAAAAAGASTSVDLALIHRLTNLNDINRILHETIAKERSIDNELDQLLSKRGDLERSFLLLNTPTAEVGAGRACTHALDRCLLPSTQQRRSIARMGSLLGLQLGASACIKHSTLYSTELKVLMG